MSRSWGQQFLRWQGGGGGGEADLLVKGVVTERLGKERVKNLKGISGYGKIRLKGNLRSEKELSSNERA